MAISNAELEKELRKSNEQDCATKRLHELLYSLSKNLVRKYFIPQHAMSYQDAIMEGYVEMVAKFRKYDLNMSNPFAYFTQMCKNCFIQLAVKQKRYSRYVQKLYMTNGDFFVKTDEELEFDLYVASKKIHKKKN